MPFSCNHALTVTDLPEHVIHLILSQLSGKDLYSLYGLCHLLNHAAKEEMARRTHRIRMRSYLCRWKESTFVLKRAKTEWTRERNKIELIVAAAYNDSQHKTPVDYTIHFLQTGMSGDDDVVEFLSDLVQQCREDISPPQYIAGALATLHCLLSTCPYATSICGLIRCMIRGYAETVPNFPTWTVNEPLPSHLCDVDKWLQRIETDMCIQYYQQLHPGATIADAEADEDFVYEQENVPRHIVEEVMGKLQYVGILDVFALLFTYDVT